MSWFSSRSMVTDPIRMAVPNPIQPSADRKSPRRLARASASPGADAGAACSGEDMGVLRLGASLRFGNAHGIRRHLGLAGIEQQPGIGLHGREYRFLRGFTRR